MVFIEGFEKLFDSALDLYILVALKSFPMLNCLTLKALFVTEKISGSHVRWLGKTDFDSLSLL